MNSYVGAENYTQVLGKGNQCSYLANHLNNLKKKGSPCVAKSGLEFTVYIRLAWNSLCVDQANLELVILLLQSPTCWSTAMYYLPHLALQCF